MSDLVVFPERPRVAVPCGCVLGEAPVWDARSDTLFWVDIKNPALWSWRPEDGAETRRLPMSEPLGFVKLLDDPNHVLVGLQSGLARLALADGRSELLVRPEPDRPGNRLNDAGLGPDGALYFGTMDNSEREPTGRFYHWTATGVAPFGALATVTNGPTYDPARGCLYTADTSGRRVFRHALAPDGTPGPAHPFVLFGEGDGHPDGITVDSESHVWVCHWGGSRITRFDPDGRAVLAVPMPTAQVTKLAFAGPDLRTAYVTTAARGRDPSTDPLAGHLFTFEPGVAGLPAGICRMGGVGPS